MSDGAPIESAREIATGVTTEPAGPTTDLAPGHPSRSASVDTGELWFSYSSGQGTSHQLRHFVCDADRKGRVARYRWGTL